MSLDRHDRIKSVVPGSTFLSTASHNPCFRRFCFSRTCFHPHSLLFLSLCAVTESVERNFPLPTAPNSNHQAPEPIQQCPLPAAGDCEIGQAQNSHCLAGSGTLWTFQCPNVALSQLYLEKWDSTQEAIRTVLMMLFCKVSCYGIFFVFLKLSSRLWK